jgi:hypothetical protein
VVAADADVAKIAFAEGTGNAVLDTLLVIAAQKGGGVERADRQVELQRRAQAPSERPVWYSFVRDFTLVEGRYQAKLVVRDAATGKIGTVRSSFEVPARDELHLSTPLLTDTLQKDARGRGRADGASRGASSGGTASSTASSACSERPRGRMGSRA